MNRLAHETSPYLLQHAANPVDWYPWGEEALARARELDLPILLSIGYSACHWCHVMERESFEDAGTAALMNRLYVPIKVDREERPDLDAIYMQAVLALTGQGGWPMTMFLTPEGEPFYGGTYFPPEPRGGMPSFSRVLTQVAEAYRERRGDVQGQAAQLTEALRQRPAPRGSGRELAGGFLTDALLALRGQFDERRGGFGGAPKFPPSCALWFLLRMRRATGSAEALAMAETTLDRMAAGGIHDQLGGGFHRYAIDAIWLVPHFEQMLYDNALLARAYLDAFETTGAARHAEVAAATLDYLVRELRLPHGGYASATDADTDGVEGSTFVWTPAQVRELLGEDAALIEALYDITEQGNFDGATVLSRVLEVAEASERSGIPAERLPELLRRMLEARALRPQPGLDDKALAAWNGMALAALAEGARVLDRADLLSAAIDCAGFLLGPLSRPDGTLWRTHRDGRSSIPGFLDDHAQVAEGLWQLHRATLDPRWLFEARRLALVADERFADPDGPGWCDTATDGEELVARPRTLDDAPTPSGASTLALLLVRIARLDDDHALEQRVRAFVSAAGDLPARAPQAFGNVLCVASSLLAGAETVAIAGLGDDEAARALGRAAVDAAGPETVVWLDPARPAPDGPAAYVCHGTTCLPPVTDSASLRNLLTDA
ncbi:MAG: thioredoxin domain-containing protein [Gaiellales bacterium]